MIVTGQHRLMIPSVGRMVQNHTWYRAELALLVDVEQLRCLAREHRSHNELKVSIVLRHCY